MITTGPIETKPISRPSVKQELNKIATAPSPKNPIPISHSEIIKKQQAGDIGAIRLEEIPKELLDAFKSYACNIILGPLQIYFDDIKKSSTGREFIKFCKDNNIDEKTAVLMINYLCKYISKVTPNKIDNMIHMAWEQLKSLAKNGESALAGQLGKVKGQADLAKIFAKSSLPPATPPDQNPYAIGRAQTIPFDSSMLEVRWKDKDAPLKLAAKLGIIDPSDLVAKQEENKLFEVA